MDEARHIVFPRRLQSSRIIARDVNHGNSRGPSSITYLALAVIALVILITAWNYHRNPRFQQRIKNLRHRPHLNMPAYNNGGVYEPPLFDSQPLRQRRAKPITMTQEEIDAIAPSFSCFTVDLKELQFKAPSLPPKQVDKAIAKPKPAMIVRQLSTLSHHSDHSAKAIEADETAKAIEADNRRDDSSEVTCSICVDGINYRHTARRITTCGHIFHSHCLEKWLSRYQSNCPLCKIELKSEESSTEEPAVVRPPVRGYRIL